jgi:thiamine-phosphate pyrophosphorylase
VIERASWWAEIFETPCIDYCPDPDSVAALIETGAEFVALGEWVFAEGVDIRAAVAAADAAITTQHARRTAR